MRFSQTGVEFVAHSQLMLLVVYMLLTGLGPANLSDMLQQYELNRTLRSSGMSQYMVYGKD